MLLREVITFVCAIFSCTAEGCPPKPPCSGSANCRATLVYENIGSNVCAVRCDTKCDSRCPPLPQCPAIKEGCTTIYKYSHISSDKVCPTRCELQCECPPQPTCPPPPSQDCITINRNKIINNRECPWECLHQCCKKDVKCPKPDPNNVYCVSTYTQYKTIKGKKCATGCFCVPDPNHATFKRR
ncbi:late cornified envelope-like proline-rich protein 1 isoform X2 [Saccostrea echinata]|uniref:late cornified envelope-like proline-rich protein 1 isoform X2 n=1 Tax=Saccostrea echinata TaxID=191078 RepID=UPI002A7FF534|nr:late cornified envelope-like proline-rich protein 1 isoform X2 [Saccostrea echinata]